MGSSERLGNKDIESLSPFLSVLKFHSCLRQLPRNLKFCFDERRTINDERYFHILLKTQSNQN
jgi:hypothetical protein